jgi:hypothetical protein
VQWCGQRDLSGGLGAACPVGSPPESDGSCARQGGTVGFSPETADGSGAEETVQRGGGGALVAGECVDEVLQLEEGTGEVTCGPKGADEGGTGELTKGERNDGTTAMVWSPGVDTRPRREGKQVRGSSGALTREDERGKKGGARW